MKINMDKDYFMNMTSEQAQIESLKTEIDFIKEMIPTTPEDIVQFLGVHFDEHHQAIDEHTFHERDRIVLTINDLLLAFADWKETLDK